jgi:uncharacterized protein
VEHLGGGRVLLDLEAQECWQLLRQDMLGRVACASPDRPSIVPVTYVVRECELLVRTDAESELGKAQAGCVVAFEADQVDRVARTGWSVMAWGVTTATSLSVRPSADEMARLEAWVPDQRNVVLRIQVGRIAGQRLLAT